MAGHLQQIIESTDPTVRNSSLEAFCRHASAVELLEECAGLEVFRHSSPSLYLRVRALFFLYAIHRFHLPGKLSAGQPGHIPFKGYSHLLQRRFEEAIEVFLSSQKAHGPNDAVSSALANAYHRLGIQTLADQVRRSVRSVRGNQWMFRLGHPLDQPLRVVPELFVPSSYDGTYPILRERTPVRMDLTTAHGAIFSFWEWIFPRARRS